MLPAEATPKGGGGGWPAQTWGGLASSAWLPDGWGGGGLASSAWHIDQMGLPPRLGCLGMGTEQCAVGGGGGGGWGWLARHGTSIRWARLLA